jgi:hypothetical protein
MTKESAQPSRAAEGLGLTVPFDLGAFWHTGIVVDDVEAAMTIFTIATGCRWAVPSTVTPRVWTPERTMDVTITYTYSVGPEPRLELVSANPGSPWDASTHGGIDHVCYWSDDIVEQSNALTRAGLPLLVTHDGDAPRRFVYHASPVPGMRIELIDRAAKPGIDEWLARPPWEQ